MQMIPELLIAVALHVPIPLEMESMPSLMVFRLGAFPTAPLKKLPAIVQLPTLETIPLVPTVGEPLMGPHLLNLSLEWLQIELPVPGVSGVRLVPVSMAVILVILMVPELEVGSPVQPMHTPPLHARLLRRPLWPYALAPPALAVPTKTPPLNPVRSPDWLASIVSLPLTQMAPPQTRPFGLPSGRLNMLWWLPRETPQWNAAPTVHRP